MIRILHVEPDPDVARQVRLLQEGRDICTVDTARSAKEALDLLGSYGYQVVVSEWDLPDMDGMAVLRKVRTQSFNILFIFFTKSGEETDRDESMKEGADFFITKSSDIRNQVFELNQIIRFSLSRIISEESLIRTEEKFHTIVDYSHEWIYWIDQNGTVLYTTPSCEDVTGYTPEEFSRDPNLVDRIIHPDDQDRWARHQEICGPDTGPIAMELRFIHKNGEERWISHVCHPVTHKDRYTGRRISNREITGKKRTEEFLLRERDNFLKVFRAAPVGLLLLNRDIEIVQANEAVSTMVLRDPSHIIHEIGGGGLGCLHSREDSRGCGFSSSCPVCPLRNGIESVIRDGTRFLGEIMPFTLLIEGKPVLRWFTVSAEPVEIGGDEYIIVAIDDITPQYETEIALRESEEKFRALAASTTAGILLYMNDQWTYANPAAEAITGYSQEELLSMQFWDLLLPEYQDRLIALGKARQKGETVPSCHIEVRIKRKDGEERWIDLVGSSITVGGKHAGLITGIDITTRKQAEENLADSEAKFRSIFENYIDLFFQTGMDGIIIMLSPSCKRLTGWEVDELIGNPALMLYPVPGDRDLLIEHLLRDGFVNDFKTQMTNRSGIPVPVSMNCHLIRDESGTPVMIEGTIRDISERKRIEDALRRSEEHYRSLFENMLEGFAYCRMEYDESGTPVDWVYLEVNDAFMQITGLSDIAGKRVSAAIPAIREETPELFGIYDRVVKSGIPETFEINFTPTRTWMKVSVYRPEVGHFVAVFEDITRRKKAEASLEKIVAELQTILENVQAMIWYKDTENRFIKVNPAAAAVFGRPAAEIEGKTFAELFPGRRDRYYDDDIAVINGKVPRVGIIEPLITAEGEHLWVQTDKIPLLVDGGTVIGILVVCTDVTERKMAKDAITLANKKLNLMSSITRHDIANQLQGLFFSLYMAAVQFPEPASREEIAKADTYAHNIERQISFTRDYQDIGVNTPVWQRVEDVIRHAALLQDLGRIHIDIDLPGLFIYADPLLGRVFYNLIDNAKRYGEKITMIRFSGEGQADRYTIICADDGVGIPTEFKKKIFNREYFKHTGFGLNLSREILEITGITITETGDTGTGARFEISVPNDGWRIERSKPGEQDQQVS